MAVTAPTPASIPSNHTSELVESLEKHNETFTTLLSLIPSKFYIAQDPVEADSKWMKNKKRKTGEEIKEHKRRAKHEKLDPSNQKTTAEILAEGPKVAQIDLEPSASSSTSTALPTQRSMFTAHSYTGGTALINPLPPAASISSLRAKLQNKLDTFRRGRGLDDGVAEGEMDAEGIESRDALERAQRERRGEMRDKRRRERKEERRKGEVKAKGAKTQLIVPPLQSLKPQSTQDTISYTSLALPSTSGGSSSLKSNKSVLKSLSNPSQALAHLNKHQQKLANLPEEKKKEIEEKERWAKAEERAAGGKIHDEEKTLKKAVKRGEKVKLKSGKEWAERKADIEKATSAAIKKRNDNIASRAEARRNKRLGIKKKPGAKKIRKGGRPGFEGKSGKGKSGDKGGKSDDRKGGKGN